MELAGVIQVTLRVAALLERLGIPYLVGGSVASSLHGIPRSTQDVDFVVDLPFAKVGAFITAVEPDFYISREAVEDAVSRRTSFNIIDNETAYKIDLFILGHDTLSHHEMQRRQSYTLDAASGRQLRVASAEDIILQKLIWYRLGNEVSHRQWRDALGVIKVQGGRLDLDYLRLRASESTLTDLLERLIQEAAALRPG